MKRSEICVGERYAVGDAKWPIQVLIVGKTATGVLAKFQTGGGLNAHEREIPCKTVIHSWDAELRRRDQLAKDVNDVRDAARGLAERLSDGALVTVDQTTIVVRMNVDQAKTLLSQLEAFGYGNG